MHICIAFSTCSACSASCGLHCNCPVLPLQVFLVGDPIQLPATVISKRAVSFGYDVSLFKRLQTAGYPVQVLDTQYRMHPDICRFPSAQFYNSGVKTGEGVEAATRRPWHAQKVSQDLHVTADPMHLPRTWSPHASLC